MNVRNQKSKVIIAENTFLLSSEKSVQTLKNIMVPQTDYYDVVIALPQAAKGNEVSYNDEASPYYVWEELDLRQFIPPPPELVPNRLWSKCLMTVNGFALIGALLLIIRLYKQLNRSQWLGLFCLTLVFCMAFASAPEQRFVIVPMISIWCFFLLWVIQQVVKWGGIVNENRLFTTSR